MGKLDGKTAIITGAAWGLGASMARVFVDEGANVVLSDLVDDAGDALARSLGDRACYAHLDVSSADDWSAVTGEAQHRFGRIDTLVNNAAITRVGPLTEIVLDDYLEVVMTNQVGVFLGMQVTAPLIAASGGGSIINISSPAANFAVDGRSAYNASKAAVLAMTKVAALELGSMGIRVNSVLPGKMLTGIADRNRPARRLHDETSGTGTTPTVDLTGRVPLGRYGEPEEVARFVVFLASDESSYATGGDFVVDGGMSCRL